MHKIIIPPFFFPPLRGSPFLIYQDQVLICLHSNANTISTNHCVNNVVSFNLNDILLWKLCGAHSNKRTSSRRRSQYNAWKNRTSVFFFLIQFNEECARLSIVCLKNFMQSPRSLRLRRHNDDFEIGCTSERRNEEKRKMRTM